jgi:alanyl-tRNA synthetase
MGEAYDYLPKRAEAIKSSLKIEEERFFDTIEAGIKIFNEELSKCKGKFSGEVAFKLYDTYGFPLDLTQDMLRERGIELDIDTFEAKMAEQKAKSRASWKGSGDALVSGDFKALEERFGANRFVGYEKTQINTKVIALLNEAFKEVDSINKMGWVMLEETPFYAESGGQVGDSGKLIIENGAPNIKVLDTKKFNNLNLSLIDTEGNILKVGDSVEAVVDEQRKEIERHHSATHLLHSALREVLGEHITQAGSLVEAKRLRFDFTHPKALTKEELEEIEKWVNHKIQRAIPSVTKVMNIDDAKKSGAMALFGEKYDKEVRVVDFEGASIELCGGTHVKNSSEIGIFIITKESGVSSGVRRIEAICSQSAREFIDNLRKERDEILKEVKNQNPLLGIKKLKEQIKELKRELDSALNSSKKELQSQKIGDVVVIVDEIASGDIKKAVDEVKNRHEKVAVMLFMKKGDKVLLASGSKNSPIKAGDWIKSVAPIVGGGGGGRADFAQAGGKDSSKISEAKKVALDYLKERLD